MDESDYIKHELVKSIQKSVRKIAFPCLGFRIFSYIIYLKPWLDMERNTIMSQGVPDNQATVEDLTEFLYELLEALNKMHQYIAIRIGAVIVGAGIWFG